MEHSPLVESVVRELAARIRDGRIPSGRPLPPERILSSQFTVSRSIVKSAIRALETLGMITCKTGCRPTVNPLRAIDAQVAVGARHIALCLWPSAGHFMTASILSGVHQATDLPDFRVVVAHASGPNWDHAIAAEARFLESVAEDPQVVGAILWYIGAEQNLPLLERAREAEVPLVFVDRLPPKSFAADFVGTDNEAAARRGVAHLVAYGHRRIALVTNRDDVSSVHGREEGYRRGLADAGLPFREALVYRDPVDGPEGIDAALESLLGIPNPPTAFLAINDNIALQLLDALRARGLEVPREISVLGFDGLLRWVPGGGSLTTILQDFERIGQLAAELLLERHSGGLPAACRHILIDAPIAEHGSTGPAPEQCPEDSTSLWRSSNDAN